MKERAPRSRNPKREESIGAQIRVPISLRRKIEEIATTKHGLTMNDFMIRAAMRELNRLEKTDPVI